MEVRIAFSFRWITSQRIPTPSPSRRGSSASASASASDRNSLSFCLCTVRFPPHFHLPDLNFLFLIPFNFHFFPSFSTKMVAQKFLVDLNKPLVFQVNPMTCFSISIFRNCHAFLPFLSLAGWTSWRRLWWVGSRAYRKQGWPSLFPKWFSGGTHIPIRYPISFFYQIVTLDRMLG